MEIIIRSKNCSNYQKMINNLIKFNNKVLFPKGIPSHFIPVGFKELYENDFVKQTSEDNLIIGLFFKTTQQIKLPDYLIPLHIKKRKRKKNNKKEELN